MSNINFTQQDLECLRGQLESVIKIISGMLGVTAKKQPRETKASKVSKYRGYLSTGSRVKKPDYLKKNPDV